MRRCAVSAFAAAGLGAWAAAFAADVVTSLTLFAGTPTGLRRSRDWGATWQDASAGAGRVLAGAGGIHAVLILGSRVLVGGDGGLFDSDDFGETWRAAGTDATVLSLEASRYLPVENVILVGTPAGLLRSEDGGASFQPAALTGTPVYRLDWPGPDLIAATGAGVRVSADGGRSFQPPGSGLPPGDVRALARSAFYAMDPVIFAGVGTTGVFRSGNGGRTWTGAGLDGHAVTDLVWLGPFLYAVSDRGVFRSEDVGRSWTRLTDGLSECVPSRLLFPLAPAAGAEAFLATDRGVFRTADGGLRWMASGLPQEPVRLLATFPQAQPGARRP